jgi:putative membrane protein
MDSRKFLSPQEIERINEAVAEAERRTSGEIVPMLVGASDDYPHLDYIGGVLGLILAAALVILLTGDPRPETWVTALMAGFVGGYLLFGLIPSLRRLALSRKKAEEEVLERALRAFHQHGISSTRGRTGILILVSLFERRVQVLADEGIHSKVPPDTWDDVVKIILEGIRSGQPGDAFCRAIRRCGELLAQHFPIAPDDRNELPNRIIIEP